MSKLTWIEYDILDIYNHAILGMVHTDGIYFYLDGSLCPNANYNIVSGKLYGSTITKEMIDYLTERNFKINNLNDLMHLHKIKPTLKVKYTLDIDSIRIYFYNNNWMSIGYYYHEPSENHIVSNKLSISKEYKQEAIEYLNSVGIKSVIKTY